MFSRCFRKIKIFYKMDFFKPFYLFLFFWSTIEGAEIFAFFPLASSSHYNVPEALLKALAARGHSVTVVTSLPQKIPVSNLHEIDVSSATQNQASKISFEMVQTTLQSAANNFNYLPLISRMNCDLVLSHPAVQRILKEQRKFDLVMTEIFGADCGVGFAWKFKAPLVSVLVSRRNPWAFSRMGNPDNPSYMHTPHSSYPLVMNFAQRLVNTYWYLYYSVFYSYSNNGLVTNKLSKKYFGEDVPSVNEIIENTSLVLANNHFSIDQSYPLVPNYIEIAGVHVKKPKPLPENIQKFMDEAKQGVIYFTLGSLIRVSSLPNETIRAFIDAFAALPQKVLWKFELELEDIPPNVFISKWFPQNDIFNHTNLRAFITHGGNSGTIEAVYFGIPMVGIPLYYDQHNNIRRLVEKGVVVLLDMNEIKKENILQSIRTVLSENYWQRMKSLSKLFHDRPLSPMETAVYWTEYVIRHKGAPHLRTVGSTMPWYQYFLIDVIAFSILIIFFSVLIIKILLKKIFKGMRNIFDPMKVKTN